MRKTTKIIITFTENNTPKAKIKNATGSQLIDAAMLLNRYSRVADRKKQNKLVRFFKRFVKSIKPKKQNTKQPVNQLYLPSFVEV